MRFSKITLCLTTVDSNYCSFTIVEQNQKQRPNKLHKKSHKDEQSATLSTMVDSDHFSTINESNQEQQKQPKKPIIQIKNSCVKYMKSRHFHKPPGNDLFYFVMKIMMIIERPR